MGPVALMLHHMKALGWTLSDRLAITKRHGTTMHLTTGEDQLFDHWLREDLRGMICARDVAVRSSGDLREIAGTNIDYTSTVQMMCAKKNKKEKEAQCLMDRRIVPAFSSVQSNGGARDQSLEEQCQQEKDCSRQACGKQLYAFSA